MIYINNSKLFELLDCASVPYMEAVLIKKATGMPSIPIDRTELFEVHFSLFYSLYITKYRAGELGYYLHLDPMRIRMIKIPEENFCHHYFPDQGVFCSNKSAASKYCSSHDKMYHGQNKKLVYDPLEEFYSNTENIQFGKDDILEKLMNGVILYSMKKGAVEDALMLFKISRPTKKRIKKRYHELAKKQHPDKINGDDSLMKELNRSYQILMEVFVI